MYTIVEFAFMPEFWKMYYDRPYWDNHEDCGRDVVLDDNKYVREGCIVRVIESMKITQPNSNTLVRVEWDDSGSKMSGWMILYGDMDMGVFAGLAHCETPNTCNECIVEHVLVS